MVRHSRAARLLGVAAITVGALMLVLAIGALVGGLNEGGFQGGLVGLVYAVLYICPAVLLLFLGRRVLRKAHPSN
jgi:membrane protein implicated in regulation of membrane protease activity